MPHFLFFDFFDSLFLNGCSYYKNGNDQGHVWAYMKTKGSTAGNERMIYFHIYAGLLCFARGSGSFSSSSTGSRWNRSWTICIFGQFNIDVFSWFLFGTL